MLYVVLITNAENTAVLFSAIDIMPVISFIHNEYWWMIVIDMVPVAEYSIDLSELDCCNGSQLIALGYWS